MRPPSFWNFCGSRRNSMISCSSSLASSTPATSLNVTFFCCDGMQPRAALAEAQRLVAAALHLPHHEDPEGEQENKGRGVDQNRDPTAGRGVFDIGVDLFIVEEVVKRGVVRGHLGMESLRGVLVYAVDIAVRDGAIPTSPAFTFSRNWVKLIGSSFMPWPVRTTANSSTATQIKTTQKINVVTFEFTKPPYRSLFQ